MDQKLTQEQLDQIVQALAEEEQEKINLDDYDPENDPDLDAEEVTLDVTNDGMLLNTFTEIKEQSASLEDANTITYRNGIIDDLIKFTLEGEGYSLYKYLFNKDPVEEDVKVIADAYADYLVYNNEKIYNKLPVFVKETVMNTSAIHSENGLNSTCIRMLSMIYPKPNLKFSNAIDIDKAVDLSLGLPSTVDIYMENIKYKMENTMKEIAEKYKDEEPEKSAMLFKVSDIFRDTYIFKSMYETYNTNSRARKEVRRLNNLKRLVAEFNYKNEKSIYKMSDCADMILGLYKALIEDSENPYYYDIDKYNDTALYSKEELIEINNKTKKYEGIEFNDNDIQKFMILFFKTCENLDATDLLQATYMYYGMKNIIVLNQSEEAKTPFAAELISNIKELLLYIREKEGEK